MKSGIREYPEDWEVTRLSNKCKIKRGASPRPIKNPLWWGGNVGWVRISDVTSATKYLNKTTEYLSDAGVNQSIKIPQGEVILTICATIGVPIIVNTAACIHDGFVWFDGLGADIDREYFYYFLLSKRELLAASRQLGTQGNLNTTIVGELIFPLPPLLEQRKIAEILSTVDEKMAVMDEQLAQTQELKKGLMQRLLTKGIGHTAFKDSPLGQIPDSWEVKNLEQLVDAKRNIRYGIVQTGENLTTGIPCLRVADFNSRAFKLESMIRTSPEISANYPSTILKKNDIVFPLRGRIGEVRLVSKDIEGINLTRGIALISTSNKIKAEYLLWQLLSPIVHKEIMLKVNGTTLQEIPITGLKKVLVPVAPEGEQLQIAAILSAVEDKITVLADKKAQYQELKRGLMQQLLTGQRRVRVAREETIAA